LAKTIFLSLVSAHIWISHLLHKKFPDLFGTILESHSMDALVNVDGILLGYSFHGGSTAFLLDSLLFRNYSARSRLEKQNMINVERTPLTTLLSLLCLLFQLLVGS
jgi:hypothetical protein